MANPVSSYTRSQVLLALSRSPVLDSIKPLDERARVSLPSEIRARSPAYLTLPELTEVLSYKLAIGVNRPFLKGMLKKNDDASVRSVSERAFAVSGMEGTDVRWDDMKSALDIVCELKGVGPALGSLVLSLLYPKGIPFFSDEAAVALLAPPGGRHGLKYSVKEYKELWEKLGDMVRAINDRDVEAGQEKSVEQGRVGRGDVERAIRAVKGEKTGMAGDDQSGTLGGKRKREDETDKSADISKTSKKKRNVRV